MSDTPMPPLPDLLVGESQTLEYKSGRTPDPELRLKISRAASAFWNSGGGTFVIGIDNSGRVDGGIGDRVSRAPRTDWIDQSVATTRPLGPYRLRCFNQQDDPTIEPERVVVAIEFGVSHLAPHMASDSRYYIRSGTSTEPAAHFIVEALYSARLATSPELALVLRHSPRASHVLQIGICCLNGQPALDVRVELSPAPLIDPELAVRDVPVVTLAHPYFFDVAQGSPGIPGLPSYDVSLSYRDVQGRPYQARRQYATGTAIGDAGPLQPRDIGSRDRRRTQDTLAEPTPL